jgi:hypothetical protein
MSALRSNFNPSTSNLAPYTFNKPNFIRTAKVSLPPAVDNNLDINYPPMVYRLQEQGVHILNHKEPLK